ncbi:hypothetical protein A6A04_10565 [Paramagnetospirillum marisnigri]|uniref:D-alanine--poly(Phosphoribitol) ligase n=1 Tax=Paramagnetospirillum marisnigri TaxID=1285242 RepID=A0A178MZT9_9PROT|nr:amino acid adenylation domain-containing protein [Paramagnetospirillum marisnigri]OAN55994.1 hypothetical protein A6A04_10565 [Paramagnetospirillum marisnigri]
MGHAFLAVARAHTNDTALVLADGGQVSYGALAARALRIAAILAEEGVAPRGVVALRNGKSPTGYAAMLACLMLGAAYVNLDELNPVLRLTRILETCRPSLLVADGESEAAVTEAASALGLRVLNLAAPELAGRLDQAPTAVPAALDQVHGGLPAYIMFTSGSTGFPKGAAISHAAVLNFVQWSQTTFGIGPGDILTNLNPLHFDNSVFDVYSALFNGAALAPVARDLLRDPRAAVETVERAGCTVWFSVPSLLIYLVSLKAIRPGSLASLRTVVFGGEGYPVPELSRLRRLLGDGPRLVNVYGPTECTCICSAHEVGAADLASARGLPPLGRIAPNFGALILDGDGPVTEGEVGELCLLGPQVGLGYVNDPERTAAAFVPNPLNPVWPETMYRTGDLVRVEGGALYFVGRKDNQVKHQGYRIELEEIEAALAALDAVERAAVVYRRQSSTHGHLVAFVVGGGPDGEAGLRAALRARLPDYMIPNRFEIVAELPLNTNGKVDRTRLRDGD